MHRLTPLLDAAAHAPARSPAALLRGRPLAIVAPHPDDETLGCGRLLHDAARAGVRCTVVCLTDGSASHRASAAWPPQRLAAARRQELHAAVSVLAPHAGIDWLGYPDCGLPEGGASRRGACARLSSALPQGALVLAAWGGDPHVDHQRGAALVAEVAKERPDLEAMWYPIWSRFAPEPPPAAICTILASPEAAEAKRLALACHATQMTRLIDDDPDGFIMSEEAQAHFLAHPEVLIAA